MKKGEMKKRELKEMDRAPSDGVSKVHSDLPQTQVGGAESGVGGGAGESGVKSGRSCVQSS